MFWLGTHPSDNGSPLLCHLSAFLPLFLLLLLFCLSVSVLTGRLARSLFPPWWLVCDVPNCLSFFPPNKQTKSYSLPPLFRFHSGSFSTPVLSQRAVYLVKRYTAAKLSRLAQKNQSPKPRYVCAGCTLHSTFSVSSLIQLPTTVRAWEKRSLNCPLPFGTIKIKSPSMLLRLYCAVVTAFPGF